MSELSPEITIPSGLRRFTLTMLSVRDQADQFKGVPRGSGKAAREIADVWKWLVAQELV